MKKKYLSIFRSFEGLDDSLVNMDFLIKKISKEFDKIFIINIDNLRFFSPQKKDYKFREKVKNLPDNYVLFNPLNTEEFSKFLEDKILIGIVIIRRELPDLKIHYLLKKYKIKKINITNYGHSGMSQIAESKNFFKFLSWNFIKFFKKFFVILAIFGFIDRDEIRFLSEKKIVQNINENFIKRLLYKYKLVYSKEIILVNSRSYDLLLDNKDSQSEDYIVHLDADLNYSQELWLRDKLSDDVVKKHYYYLEKFLKKLSKIFNKKVVVCIHPAYDIEKHQSYLKDFEVIKFKTPEYIRKSFIVTNFDSSAVADAVLCKKKIIGLISNFMTKNEIEHTKSQASRNGYLCFNIEDDYLIDKNVFLAKLNNSSNNFEKIISNYHCYEPNVLGSDKIIKIIKERFFD